MLLEYGSNLVLYECPVPLSFAPQYLMNALMGGIHNNVRHLGDFRRSQGISHTIPVQYRHVSTGPLDRLSEMPNMLETRFFVSFFIYFNPKSIPTWPEISSASTKLVGDGVSLGKNIPKPMTSFVLFLSLGIFKRNDMITSNLAG